MMKSVRTLTSISAYGRRFGLSLRQYRTMPAFTHRALVGNDLSGVERLGMPECRRSMNQETCPAANPGRILFISDLGFWSMGEGRGAPSLARTLLGYVDQGWDVVFVTGAGRQERDIPAHSGNLKVISFSAGLFVSLMKVRRIGFVGRALWWLWFQVRVFLVSARLRRRGKFDLVYGYETYGVPVGRLLANLWHVPFVARFQGTCLLVSCVRRRLWRVRAWDHIIALGTHADLIIMTNDGTAGDEALALLGADMDRVRFWVNGVDRTAFTGALDVHEARAELRLSEGPVLLAVSRLDTWKRLDRAIEAMPGILAKSPRTVLLIVGDGDEHPHLVALTERLGVAEHVRFEGAVPHAQVPLYLAAADIFLSLYDWSNVGNPLLEAMAVGKPIVTLNNGATAKFVRHLENGVLLSPTGDVPGAVAAAVNWLLADPDEAARLAAGAKAFAETELWSWDERMAAEIAEVDRLLHKRDGGRREEAQST